MHDTAVAPRDVLPASLENDDPASAKDDLEHALSVVQAKDIEIVEGMALVNSALVTGKPRLASLRRQFGRGRLIGDLTADLEAAAASLQDGRGRLLRRLAVAYRALLVDLQTLLDITVNRGTVPKKTYRNLTANAVELIGLIEETKSKFWDLLASTDELTGLLNRHALEDSFELISRRSQQHGSTLAVGLLDIDHFKAINDGHGHDAGDTALVEVARAVTASLRPRDIAIRYGGEEIAILLPEMDGRRSRLAFERLRKAVEALTIEISGGDPIRLTTSIGYTLKTPRDDLETLLKRADDALYRAKDSGRNRVVQAAVR